MLSSPLQEAVIRARATAPAYLRCDLRTFPLTVASLGTKFDVIYIDPPWDEYHQRQSALGITAPSGKGAGDSEPWGWEARGPRAPCAALHAFMHS